MGPSTLATLFNHMWPRIVAGIFIPVGNHYFQALASTLQFVTQVCDRLWLVPATDRAFEYITYMSPPHVALVCSGSATMRGHMWLNKVASVLGPFIIVDCKMHKQERLKNMILCFVLFNFLKPVFTI